MVLLEIVMLNEVKKKIPLSLKPAMMSLIVLVLIAKRGCLPQQLLRRSLSDQHGWSTTDLGLIRHHQNAFFLSTRLLQETRRLLHSTYLVLLLFYSVPPGPNVENLITSMNQHTLSRVLPMRLA